MTDQIPYVLEKYTSPIPLNLVRSDQHFTVGKRPKVFVLGYYFLPQKRKTTRTQIGLTLCPLEWKGASKNKKYPVPIELKSGVLTKGLYIDPESVERPFHTRPPLTDFAEILQAKLKDLETFERDTGCPFVASDYYSPVTPSGASNIRRTVDLGELKEITEILGSEVEVRPEIRHFDRISALRSLGADCYYHFTVDDIPEEELRAFESTFTDDEKAEILCLRPWNLHVRQALWSAVCDGAYTSGLSEKEQRKITHEAEALCTNAVSKIWSESETAREMMTRPYKNENLHKTFRRFSPGLFAEKCRGRISDIVEQEITRREEMHRPKVKLVESRFKKVKAVREDLPDGAIWYLVATHNWKYLFEDSRDFYTADEVRSAGIEVMRCD